MRRIILFTLLCLTLFGGVAAADRYRGSYDRDHRHHEYRDHHGYRRDKFRDNYRHTVYRNKYYRNNYNYDYRPYRQRTWNRPTYYGHSVRRPIYVQRPYIPYRYANYYQRPALLIEDYAPMTGYTWVRGTWYWNGFEWLWQPGHYEPITYYDQGYVY